MQRFFLDNEFGSDFIINDKSLLNQISKVLRGKIGDEFLFFNGRESKDYLYCLDEIGKKSLKFRYISGLEREKDKSGVVLYQAMPNKIDKIELILQKGTEIGVEEFVFFEASRSQKLKISDNKIERLNKIIIEASEQSYRNFIPKFEIISRLEIPEGNNIFFHTRCEKSLGIENIRGKYNSLNLFIGPEGGFSLEEIEEFEKSGMEKIHLGKNILRCETAAICLAFYGVNLIK